MGIIADALGYIPFVGEPIADGLRSVTGPIADDWRRGEQNTQAAQDALNRLSRGAEGFARAGQRGYDQWGNDLRGTAGMLQRRATGEDSLSAEQLRQGLQQQIAAQQSAAAGARPGNQAMAARNAMNNIASAGYGMSGQQAMAGIAERQAAANALAQLQGQARGQDLQAALTSRQTAIQPYIAQYNANVNKPSFAQNVTGAAGKALDGLFSMFSDQTLKTDIKEELEPEEFLDAIRAYNYKYKSEKHGAGQQFGLMAQDLEKSKLGKTMVTNTPEGKMVDARKLAAGLAAASSSMHKRLKAIEKKLG